MPKGTPERTYADETMTVDYYPEDGSTVTRIGNAVHHEIATLGQPVMEGGPYLDGQRKPEPSHYPNSNDSRDHTRRLRHEQSSRRRQWIATR